MYILPNGIKTSNWEVYNRAWRKFLAKYAKALGLSIESIDGDSVTFGHHVMRGNGKPALTKTIAVPKTFLLAAVYQWLDLKEKCAELQNELDDLILDEEEDSDEDESIAE